MNTSRASRGPRISERGGIRKSRHSTPTRIDRDGDIDMSSGGSTGRGRPNRGTRGNRGQNHHPIEDQSGRGRLHQQSHASERPARLPRRSNLTNDRLSKAIGNGDIVMSSADPSAEGLVRISIKGLRDTAVYKNPRSHNTPLNSLIEWVEKQASRNAGVDVKIDRSKCHEAKKGPGLVYLSVAPEFVDAIVTLDQKSFAGAVMSIRKQGLDSSATTGTSNPGNQHQNRKEEEVAAKVMEVLAYIVEARWNRADKTFDLSSLVHEPALVSRGVFDNESTTKKFFPALMKLCDSIMEGPKHEMVTALSLANNGMSSLLVVSPVAATFPRLRHLVLSNNNLRLDALGTLRWKFRELAQLEVDANPLSDQAETKDTIMKWFPKLQQLNLGNGLEQVRDPRQIEAERNPIPIMAASFQDEADIGAKFITDFFPAFDNNRHAVLDQYYDNDSSFSLSFNSRRPRISQGRDNDADLQHYLRSSRNLLRITHLPARVVRLFTGKKEIGAFWATLPKTRHPDPSMYPNSWMIECHSLPGVPDPSGQSPGGVAGLLISASGSFEELDRTTGKETTQPYFHRSFVLGPGAVPGTIRVVSDIWTIRHSPALDLGNWKLDNPSSKHTGAPPGFGEPGMGKSMEQVEKERLTMELSHSTGLVLNVAKECYEKNNWDKVQALADVARLKAQGSIPNEWLMPQAIRKSDGVAGFGPPMGGAMADIT
ncbi:MAG: hypothetical protein Q9227_005156 [Pyrenula ochraceoflavens]